MTIKELREKRKKAWDTARDFLDSKRNANGVLSEEDSKTYDAMGFGLFRPAVSARYHSGNAVAVGTPRCTGWKDYL